MLIEINSTQVGLKFNNYAIEQLAKVKGSGNSYFGFVATLVWCAYLGWCFAKQVEPKLDFEAITEWVDSSVNNDNVAKQITAVYELYTESEAYKKLQKKSEPNGVNGHESKKSSSKKSTSSPGVKSD